MAKNYQNQVCTLYWTELIDDLIVGLTRGREAGSRGSLKWVKFGVRDKARGQIDYDMYVGEAPRQAWLLAWFKHLLALQTLQNLERMLG